MAEKPTLETRAPRQATRVGHNSKGLWAIPKGKASLRGAFVFLAKY